MKTRKLCICALTAALYAAITVMAAPLSYGAVQFRLSEALVVLCRFEPSLWLGLTLGCLIANFFSTVTALDVVIGTAATALGCFLTVKIRSDFLAPLANALVNTVLVGGMLAYVLSADNWLAGFAAVSLQIGIGEITVMYALGLPLLLFAKKTDFMKKLMGTEKI